MTVAERTKAMQDGLVRYRSEQRAAAIERVEAFLRWVREDAARWAAVRDLPLASAHRVEYRTWSSENPMPRVTDSDFAAAREAGVIS